MILGIHNLKYLNKKNIINFNINGLSLMIEKKLCGTCNFELIEVKGSCGCKKAKQYFCRKCQIIIPPQRIKTIKA